MNTFYIRYLLSREIGLAISIIGIIISLFTLFVVVKAENKKYRVLMCGVASILISVLLINAYMMKDYVKMPNVKTLEVDSAKQTLYGLGFENVSVIEKDKKPISGDSIVEIQSETANNIIKKDVEIILTCIVNEDISKDNAEDNEKNSRNDSDNKQEANTNDVDTLSNTTDNDLPNDMSNNDKDIDTVVSDNDNNTNNSLDDDISPNKKENIEIDNTTNSVVNTQTTITTSDLAIIIEEYEFFSDGFHYKEPINENTYNGVDFDQGISGHFSYSRELTDTEYENWRHGGKLLDESGQECGFANSFFSTTDGIFAVELSPNIPSGNYVYVLYQYINNKYCEARISFSI